MLRIFKDWYYLFKLLNTHVGNLGKKALSMGIEVLSSEFFVVYSKEDRVFWISRYLGITCYSNLALMITNHEEQEESLVIE